MGNQFYAFVMQVMTWFQFKIFFLSFSKSSSTMEKCKCRRGHGFVWEFVVCRHCRNFNALFVRIFFKKNPKAIYACISERMTSFSGKSAVVQTSIWPQKRTIVSQISHAIYSLTSFRRGFFSVMIKTSRFPYVYWKLLMMIQKYTRLFEFTTQFCGKLIIISNFPDVYPFLHNLPPFRGKNVVSWTALNVVIPPAAVSAVGSKRPTTLHFPSCLSNFLR